MKKGWGEVFATAGLVFISFGGLTKVASVAEEVHHPGRNIPAGMFLAALVVTALYVAAAFVVVGVMDAGELTGNLAYNWPIGCAVDVLLRPDDVLISDGGEYEVEIVDRAFKGAETLYTVRLPTGEEILSLAPSHVDLRVGQRSGITLSADHLILFQKG